MLETITFFDISILSAVLITIMLIIARIKRDHFTFSSRLLRWIMIVTLVGVLLEPVTWLVDEKSGTLFYVLNHLSNNLLFIIGTMLMGLWLSYWDYKLLLSKKRIEHHRYYQYAVGVQVILLMYNLFTGVFFEISTHNQFIEGDLYAIPFLVYYAMFLYLIVFVIMHRQHAQHHVLQGTLLFMIFPFVNSLIQIVFPEIILTWPSLTLAIWVVYLFLETTSGNVDELTKLYTRGLLELHLRSLIEEKKNFHAMMIDLDRFKEVNDIYGHLTGDQVLYRFAQLLKECHRLTSTFIARLGGDEFFLICQSDTDRDPMDMIHHIHQQFTQDEFFKKFPFLGFSAGYVVYDHLMSFDDILNLADKRMYAMKNDHQQQINTPKSI